jgi:Amiloride-sensitive sodium channel
MQVYFSELKYTYTESTAAYTWFALLSDVGGALGLILGSTVLTFFEFGDLILTLIFTTIDRNIKQKAAKSRKAAAAAHAAMLRDKF